MQQRQLFFNSIAIRNASDDIQVFDEIFVSCYLHVFVLLNFRAWNVQSQVLVDITPCKDQISSHELQWPSVNAQQS